MNNHVSTLRRIVGACATGCFLGLSTCAAFAAEPAASADAKARYEQERARCLSGTSGQAQATCLKEAGAALEASRQGMLNDRGAKYGKNAKERCDLLSGDEKVDCIARMKAAPNTTESGSVKGGGILRETVTVETHPAPPASAASE
ncbi:MAG: hypothetical protein M3O01_09655 [Pseudomonadota bacterium]|nr:hypothetical protein [Pseudomonadota bacterium]